MTHLEIKVPAMGESITEATVGNIIKPSGSDVKMDDEILELETDKVNQVLYAGQAGKLNLTVKPDEVVKIGQVIGTIEGNGANKEPPPKEAEEPKKEKQAVEEKKEAAPKAEKKETPTAQKPSPAQRGIRQSKEAYVSELSEKKPAEKKPSNEPVKKIEKSERSETRRRMTKIRKVIAKRLVEAKSATAMLTTFNEVDLTEVMSLRSKYKDSFAKQHGAKLGFMSFFVKAAVAALAAYPDINSYIDGEEIVHREYFDIGIAVGTERGLIVPVLRDCDQLTFSGIEQAIENFAVKAREGDLTVDDLQGGGFTITNGGVYGSLLSTPILNHPQVGILGMHKIEKRPVVVDDQIVIRPMMYLALSYDHRIVDGKEAVSFLVHIKNSLEDPARLLLEV
jgi:2-oxoglutarate dehydrogenase E2 component (dihydrolipoamide succinyltransferase)